MDDYISKPVDRKTLYNIIAKWTMVPADDPTSTFKDGKVTPGSDSPLEPSPVQWAGHGGPPRTSSAERLDLAAAAAELAAASGAV
mmetsp:Transcript_47590/g.113316  ORF Transcript_47590/g.113316 Transcript_47590/m.113316 type:complete len:85 (-) Transcript_47590:47-301(-)